MINPGFPWQPLGDLLVDQGLLTPTELELALADQAKTGRLLGQIVVDHGYVTAFSLARVLSEQHGVELRPAAVDDVPTVRVDEESSETPAWRPLGRVLVDSGYLAKEELDKALEIQRDRGGRLGEILIARGSMTGQSLARAIAEQHGVELDQSDANDMETVVKPAAPGEPVYQVSEIAFRPGYQSRTVLFENTNFLESADYAYEYVQEHEPSALEILRIEGETNEVVWTYSASRAAAMEANKTKLVDTFGFDPVKWGH
jgi:hypothetical protein